MVARVYQSVQTRVFMDTVFGQTRVNVNWVLVEKTVQNVRKFRFCEIEFKRKILLSL